MDCTREYWWSSDYGVYGDGEFGRRDLFVGRTVVHCHGPGEWYELHVYCDSNK